jgi:hypothetical protein
LVPWLTFGAEAMTTTQARSSPPLHAAARALLFDPLVPNVETVAAMKAVHRRDLVTAGDRGSLLADLGAECRE